MRFLVALVICSLCGTASADRADQLFKQGKKLLAQKKYAEACAAFEESDRIDPEIGAKLNVAKCYQDWGKLATAYRWYVDAENMASKVKDDRAKKIHSVMEELDPSVPRLTVRAPADADLASVVVKVDGVALDRSALGIAQRIDPGPHDIDTIVAGEKATQVIPVRRGSSAEVV